MSENLNKKLDQKYRDGYVKGFQLALRLIDGGVPSKKLQIFLDEQLSEWKTEIYTGRFNPPPGFSK